MGSGQVDDGPAAVVRACRVLAEAGHADTPFGGVVVRGGDGVLLTTPRGFGLAEVVASGIVSLDGAEGLARMPSWVQAAHALIAARSGVGAVVHTHALHAVAFSTRRLPLRALSHEGCHLVPPEMARLETSAPDAVVAALTRAPVCLLRGHGLLAAASTLGDAVALAIYAERTCAMNLLAGGAGAGPEEGDLLLAKRRGQLNRPTMSWRYLERRLGVLGG